MKTRVYSRFISVILFLGISLFLLNCEQTDYLTLNQTNKNQPIQIEEISIEEVLNIENITTSLKKFDINLNNDTSKQKKEFFKFYYFN